jgi:UbiD family decarboxylase
VAHTSRLQRAKSGDARGDGVRATPAFHLDACYPGPFEVREFDIIGSYLQYPLRLTPSEIWGDDLLIPAAADIVIEGALIPGKRRRGTVQ